MDGSVDSANSAAAHSWVLDAVAGLRDALVVVDDARRLVYHNAAAERLVGLRSLAPDEATWSRDYGIYHPDEKTPFDTAQLPVLAALSGTEVRDVGLFVRNRAVPQGIHILASANPLRDARGRIRGSAMMFRDVTLHRQQEAQVREAERLTKAILDNLPDIAWLKDPEGRFLLVNQPLAAAAGKAHPEELVGRTDLDFWPRRLADQYRADDEIIIATGKSMRIEEPIVYASGRNGWIETVKTRIVDDAGKVLGTTGISRDITERKRAEQDMRSMTDELERRVLERTAELAEAQENLVRQERLAILGQLAGGVAHQIRNPLAAIMNAAYVLKRHLLPEQHPNVGDAIGIIHDEVRHANIIITGLLDYARVRTPDRHPASLVDMLERILGADWIPPGVRVVRDLPPSGTVILSVDTDQLQGAISNLVRNAIDAMPDGGELGVELGAREEEVIITVSDTGTGLSPQVRAHLFEPLHSTKPLGIGLGLVTARRFVEAHGGKILHVDVPKGARFEVRLPTRYP